MRSILQLARLGERPDAPFPPTSAALESPNGLLAWGGDLHPARLIEAYRRGIFPWYSEGQPVLWWSPAPRCVIFPESVYLSRRTRRRYNSGKFRLTADTAFRQVVANCAERKESDGGTWITAEMMKAYGRLHEMGRAHSVEAWEGDELAGGIYGLALGDVFFGESMFSRRSDASKVALVALCLQLERWGFILLDCQVGNSHLYTMGAEDLEREAFEALLRDGLAEERTAGSWRETFRFEDRW
jgi:leucyl/phenylalanyl-tRNA--protein transferase